MVVRCKCIPVEYSKKEIQVIIEENTADAFPEGIPSIDWVSYYVLEDMSKAFHAYIENSDGKSNYLPIGYHQLLRNISSHKVKVFHEEDFLKDKLGAKSHKKGAFEITFKGLVRLRGNRPELYHIALCTLNDGRAYLIE